MSDRVRCPVKAPKIPDNERRGARAESVASDVAMVDDNSEVSAQESEDAMVVELPPGEKAIANSPLFRLPREIRDIIWSLCLVSSRPIRWPSRSCTAGLAPVLLATCQKIHSETISILYERNTLNFSHPSDANMFLWVHAGSDNDGVEKPFNGQMVMKLELTCMDYDVRMLWTGYLGSTSLNRSIMHDYPHMKVLHITVRSHFWDGLHGDVIDRYRRWQGDRNLRELFQAMDGRIPKGTEVKIMLIHRVPRIDLAALKSAYPRDLLLVRDLDGVARGEVRTRWTPLYLAEAALELRPVEEFLGP